MTKFIKFTESDFNCFISKKDKLLQRVKKKMEDLVKILSKRLGNHDHPGIYEYRTGRFAGYLSKSKNRKSNAFFNIQLNADDLSLEFQIENRGLLSKFLRNGNVKILKNLGRLGDCEIAIWDRNKKVCKFYPTYLNELEIKFLLNKLKSTTYPIFKFRKIYPRDDAKKLLKSPRLLQDLLQSMKIMEILYKFI